MRPMTRLPGAPRYVRGLLNMRGTIVTVVDLAARLDPTRAPARDGSIVLLRHRDRLVGILVDEVADVREIVIDDSALQVGGGGGEPEGAAVSRGPAMRGVATVDDATVFMLDLGALLTQVLLS